MLFLGFRIFLLDLYYSWFFFNAYKSGLYLSLNTKIWIPTVIMTWLMINYISNWLSLPTLTTDMQVNDEKLLIIKYYLKNKGTLREMHHLLHRHNYAPPLFYSWGVYLQMPRMRSYILNSNFKSNYIYKFTFQ